MLKANASANSYIKTDIKVEFFMDSTCLLGVGI